MVALPLWIEKTSMQNVPDLRKCNFGGRFAILPQVR